MSAPVIDRERSQRIGDVVSYVRGITFKPADVVPLGSANSIVCFRTKNVQAELDLSDLISIPQDMVNREDQLVCPGDILISSANSWNLVGKCCWVPELTFPSTLGGFISLVRPKSDRLDRRYLYHWLSSPETQQTLRGFGRQTTNISNLDVHRFLEMKMPLPPLLEQKRIAAILDRVEEIRQGASAALRLQREFLESAFVDIFVDSHGWPASQIAWKPLHQVCSKITDGEHLNPRFTDSGMPIIMAGEVRESGVDFSRAKHVKYEDGLRFRRKCNPEKGDVLVVSRGATIGRCTQVTSDQEFCLMGSVILLKPDRRFISSPYLEMLLTMPYFAQRLKSTSGASAQQAIYLTHLGEVRIPVPSAELQQRYSSVAGAGERLSTHLQSRLTEALRLVSAMSPQSLLGQDFNNPLASVRSSGFRAPGRGASIEQR